MCSYLYIDKAFATKDQFLGIYSTIQNPKSLIERSFFFWTSFQAFVRESITGKEDYETNK